MRSCLARTTPGVLARIVQETYPVKSGSVVDIKSTSRPAPYTLQTTERIYVQFLTTEGRYSTHLHDSALFSLHTNRRLFTPKLNQHRCDFSPRLLKKANSYQDSPWLRLGVCMTGLSLPILSTSLVMLSLVTGWIPEQCVWPKPKPEGPLRKAITRSSGDCWTTIIFRMLVSVASMGSSHQSTSFGSCSALEAG